MIFRQFTILERKPKIMRFFLLLLSSLLSLSTHAQIDADLSLHYKFDDDLTDASETMLDGIQLGGDLAFEEGVAGSAVVFSDRGEHVYVDTSYKLELPFSISVWVKPQNVTRAWQTVIGKYQVAFYGSFWFGLHFDKANMWLPIGNGQEVFYDSQTALVQDEWSHIVWVCDDNNEGKMYINGEEDVVMGAIPDVFQNSDSLMIGRQALYLDITGDFANYHGGMDDLRVYSKALSDEDIDNLFQMTSSTVEDARLTPQVFPNPSSGIFQLTNVEPTTEVSIYDSMGKVVLAKRVSELSNIIDLSDYDEGVYYSILKTDRTAHTYKLQVIK